MRYQLPFDRARAAAQLAALVAVVVLLVLVGSIRSDGTTSASRSGDPANPVPDGAPGLFLLGKSGHR